MGNQRNNPTFSPARLAEPAQTGWIIVLRHVANFPLEAFFAVVENLLLHPELSSSIILRADILSDTASGGGDGRYRSVADVEGKFKALNGPKWIEQRKVRRRLLPRTPRDASLEQDCIFSACHEGCCGHFALHPLLDPTLLEEAQEAALPFYHPCVKALAFSYRDHASDSSSEASLELSILPFASQKAFPLPPESRLARSLLALLRIVHKHSTSLSSSTPYIKRAHHDRLVPREEYQDLYLELKRKYLWVLDEWRESTDPEKHVFEDVAIATWLMCLWKEMYPSRSGGERGSWGRPPGGFVDVGCGNGFLVYILSNEGYPGFGFDLRSRKSWNLFAPLGADLRVSAFSPSSLLLDPSSIAPGLPVPEEAFLIGNHADELTPWVPVMTTLASGCASANIPCCLHRLQDRFTNSKYTMTRYEVLDAFGLGDESVSEETDAAARDAVAKTALESVVGSTELGGRYKAYLRYIASLTLVCGFIPEHEALRIPSTKNLAIVARARCADAGYLSDAERDRAKARALERARAMIVEVDGRWTAREPESDKSHG